MGWALIIFHDGKMTASRCSSSADAKGAAAPLATPCPEGAAEPQCGYLTAGAGTVPHSGHLASGVRPARSLATQEGQSPRRGATPRASRAPSGSERPRTASTAGRGRGRRRDRHEQSRTEKCHTRAPRGQPLGLERRGGCRRRPCQRTEPEAPVEHTDPRPARQGLARRCTTSSGPWRIRQDWPRGPPSPPFQVPESTVGPATFAWRQFTRSPRPLRTPSPYLGRWPLAPCAAEAAPGAAGPPFGPLVAVLGRFAIG